MACLWRAWWPQLTRTWMGTVLPVSCLQTGTGISIFPLDPQGVSICENCGEQGVTHTPRPGGRAQKPDATQGTRRVGGRRGCLRACHLVRLFVCVFTRLTGSLEAEREPAGLLGGWLCGLVSLAGPQRPHLSHSPSVLWTKMQAHLMTSYSLTEDHGTFKEEYLRTNIEKFREDSMRGILEMMKLQRWSVDEWWPGDWEKAGRAHP